MLVYLVASSSSSNSSSSILNFCEVLSKVVMGERLAPPALPGGSSMFVIHMGSSQRSGEEGGGLGDESGAVVGHPRRCWMRK
jgi:hypothetical protein